VDADLATADDVTGIDVSVVLPTRNRAGRIARAVESVIAQTFRGWELIIVDDASTDGTPDAIASLAARDPRIRSERMESPAGAAVARNRGIALARGRFVAFLDDDAYWEPEKLRLQMARLDAEGPEVGVCYCRFVYRDAAGKECVVGSPAAEGASPRAALLRENFIDTSVVVVRTELIHRVGGFDERLPRLQDWDLWLRLAEVTRFAFLDDTLVTTEFSAGGISTRSDALVAACSHLDAKLGARLGRRERALWTCTLGHTLMTGGAPHWGRAFLWRAALRHPGSLRRLSLAALSTLGEGPYNALVRLRLRMARSRSAHAASRLR
jgi:glycosyltransferase involved in cell wall biosynthesis